MLHAAANLGAMLIAVALLGVDLWVVGIAALGYVVAHPTRGPLAAGQALLAFGIGAAAYVAIVVAVVAFVSAPHALDGAAVPVPVPPGRSRSQGHSVVAPVGGGAAGGAIEQMTQRNGVFGGALGAETAAVDAFAAAIEAYVDFHCRHQVAVALLGEGRLLFLSV